MGDEIATTTAPSNSTAVPPAGANEDLLSQIFGGIPTNSGLAPSAPANKQKAIDDILGLFGSSGGAAAQPAPAAAPLASLFGQTAAPVPAPASAPATAVQPPASQQQAQTYTAYEKNGLKVSLRPQVSATRPGVVLVTARFEATGVAAITGINFQAAVPKACLAFQLRNEGG